MHVIKIKEFARNFYARLHQRLLPHVLQSFCEFASDIEKISNHYGDVPEGEKLAFFNEVGFLEIAVNKGYAAPLFGLGEFGTGDSRQHERRQYYQTVKVFFE